MIATVSEKRDKIRPEQVFHSPSILDALQQLCSRKACTAPKGVPLMVLAQHLGNGDYNSLV